MRSMEDMGDELCDYCPIPDEAKGIHVTPNGYSACEGSRCPVAYERYKEECMKCVLCGELVHPDDAKYIQKAADDEYGPFCEKCYEEARL